MALTVNFTGYDSLSTETLPTYGAETGGTGVPVDGFRRVYTLHNVVDSALTGGTNTSTDTYEAIYIPAGLRIIDSWFIVREAEATNTTAQVSLGIGGDVDEFVTAATVAATGIHYANGDHVALAIGGTNVTSADTIDLTVSVAALTNAVFDVYATVIDNRADI